MSFIIDTHCHLSSDYKDDELSSILNEAKLIGVKYLFDVGYDLESSNKLSENILEHNNVFGMVGIHPDNSKDIKSNDLRFIEKLASSNSKIIGIGEIGLDYYHLSSPKDIQKDIFIKQLRIAKKLNLPVSIHVRDKKNVYLAYEDCLSILKSEKINNGVMHCYSGTYELAKKFIELGMYISFSGILTFKNAPLTEEVAKKISINKILVETDAPYLAPDPYRGTTNYPAYIKFTIKKLALIKKLPFQEINNILYKNTLKVFNIKK